jgi:hypothetical protein
VIVAPALVREIAGLAVNLPNGAARTRFIDSAGEALAKAVDGSKPSQRAVQTRVAVARELTERTATESTGHETAAMTFGR